MTTAPAFPFTPYDEYLAPEASSDVKHEWIHGLVYAMSRGTPEHGKSLGEAITNPIVVVEVLSRSTANRDRNERFVLFQQVESLQEYVPVSQDERRIEVRRRDGRGWTTEVAGPGESICIHGIELHVDTIYA